MRLLDFFGILFKGPDEVVEASGIFMVPDLMAKKRDKVNISSGENKLYDVTLVMFCTTNSPHVLKFCSTLKLYGLVKKRKLSQVKIC